MKARAPLRRVGLVGDAHCQAGALASAIPFLRAQGVDALLQVGDILDGDGDATRTCELLEEHDFIAVAGNHDRWALGDTIRDLPHATRLAELSDDAARFLRSLPRARELETAAGLALLCHGMGENDMACVKAEDGADRLAANAELQALLSAGRHAWVLNGHTHERLVRRVGSLTIVNAGTLLPGDSPCVAVVDFGAESATFFDWAAGGRFSPAETVRLDSWSEVF